MSNVGQSKARINKVTAKWKRRLARWEARRQAKHDLDEMIAAYMIMDIPAIPPRSTPSPSPSLQQNKTFGMTSPMDSDGNVLSVDSSSTTRDLGDLVVSPNASPSTVPCAPCGNLVDPCIVPTSLPPPAPGEVLSLSSVDDDDSIFGIPSLHIRDDSSSDGSSTDFHTASDGSSYHSAHDDIGEVITVTSDDSSVWSVSSLGPPPPGSIMAYWDKPFPTSCLHDFPYRGENSKFAFADTVSLSSSSDSDQLEEMMDSDDDTYAEWNPVDTSPSLSLVPFSACVQVSCLDTPVSSLTYHKESHRGELIDTGGNFNMTNRVDSLQNVTAVRPFSVDMAAKETASTSKCTHRGEFPLKMNDGSTFFTPVFYNPSASETILSPEAICFNSRGLLTHWCQSGSTTSPFGSVSFFNKDGAELISLTLQKRNGLYYTTVDTMSVDSGPSPSQSRSEAYVYLHSHEDDPLDEISLDCDDGCTPFCDDYMSIPLPVSQPLPEFSTPSVSPTSTPSMPTPLMPPLCIPTPKSCRFSPDRDEFVPKTRQIEADLWQARLGHCCEWQLKVLPLSTEGTPARFYPHPFSSYDHYNKARIRKRPATRGKHPSRAVLRAQRKYMDFGFLRASTFDFARPDKLKDKVVESFDGYNSYLLIVDEFTKMIWIYLCKSKEPPIDVILAHLDRYGAKEGFIRVDQGGELAKCKDFVTAMLKCHYVVEPTSSEGASQNKQAEKYNDTLATTVKTLLYGAGLPAQFWSAALLHAVYLHNRRVNKSTMMTPFEAWYGVKPDLRNLKVFGSRVCVRRTGKRRMKLNRHDFTGIFIGFTATDENIRYIDVYSRIVKSSHHAIFDEAWYLHPQRPLFAQMLYDIGLEPELQEDDIDLACTNVPVPYPPMSIKAPSKLPLVTTRVPLPLRISTPPNVFTAAAARTEAIQQDLRDDTPVQFVAPEPMSFDHDVIRTHDISSRDLEMVYMSPSHYNDSFEEVLDLRRFDLRTSSTAGLKCQETSGKLFLRDMKPSTPAARIRAWRSRLRDAWLIAVDGAPVSSVRDLEAELLRAKQNDRTSCRLLFAHSAIRDGLVEEGIPQVNVDQLNNRHDLHRIEVMTQTQFDQWFASLPPVFYEVVKEGGVLNLLTACHKLTRRQLLQQDDWEDWRKAEHIQLDCYETQYMFGTPCPPTKRSAIFNLIWSYAIKVEDNRRKARCTCDGSTRGGAVRVFDHTYANSIDQTSSRIFYALAAAEGLLCFGSDVSNAFGEAPPPKQGFFIRPDRAFRDWWESKGRPPIPEGWVVPVLAAMQGHPESGRLWEKHIDHILRKYLRLIPTVHEPCLYCSPEGTPRVIFKRQVDDFLVAVATQLLADKVFDEIDKHLSMPMRRQGLMTFYNGIDVLQSRWYIKISVETYLRRALEPYLATWLEIPSTPLPTPFGKSESFLRRLYEAKGDKDPKIIQKLEKAHGFKYRQVIGTLVWPMSVCRPDLSQAVVKCAQASACPADIHFLAVKSICRYLVATMSVGICYWRVDPRTDLPDDPLPPIQSRPHDIQLQDRPTDTPQVMSGYMDTSWGDCLWTRRSFAGFCLMLNGACVSYKSRLQPTVAQSSTEAEFINYSDTARACLYVRSILWDLGVPQEAATILYGDNDGATAMANAGKPTKRSRHLDIKYYALQEFVERDLMIIARIATAQNMSDHFTKPLSKLLFYRHRDFYMGHVPPAYSLKYRDFERKYLFAKDRVSLPDGVQGPITATAARTIAAWDVIVQTMYLMAISHSKSCRSLKCGGVTDTYDTYTRLVS